MKDIKEEIMNNSVLSVNREGRISMASYTDCNGTKLPMYTLSADALLRLSHRYNIGEKNKLILLIWEKFDKIKMNCLNSSEMEKTNE